MNNKNMIFLLLAVVVAAMAIIMLTRPGPSNVEGTQRAVAEAPSGNTGTENAPPANAAGQAARDEAPAVPAQTDQAQTDQAQTGQAQTGQARSASSDTSAQTLPPEIPAPAVQAPVLPETPAAPGAPAASGGEDAPRAAGGETAVPAPATPAPAAPEAPAATALPQSPRPGQEQTQSQPQARVQTPPPAQAQPASQPAGENSLSIMALRFAGQGMILKIQAESAFTSKTFALTAPDRLVVDLGGEWSNMRAPMVPDNNLIKGARTGRQESAARLVLDLIKPLKRFETVRVSPSEVEIHME